MPVFPRAPGDNCAHLFPRLSFELSPLQVNTASSQADPVVRVRSVPFLNVELPGAPGPSGGVGIQGPPAQGEPFLN